MPKIDPPQDPNAAPKAQQDAAPNISLTTFLETDVTTEAERAVLGALHRDDKLTRAGWRQAADAALTREVK